MGVALTTIVIMPEPWVKLGLMQDILTTLAGIVTLRPRLDCALLRGLLSR